MWWCIRSVKYKRGRLILIRCRKMINKFWKIIEWWTYHVGVAAVCVRRRLSRVGFGCYGVACWPESMGGVCHWFSVPWSITVAVVVVCIILPSSSLIFLFGIVVRAIGCVLACHIHVYCLKYALHMLIKGCWFLYKGLCSRCLVNDLPVWPP